jgi:hypothetical protein
MRESTLRANIPARNKKRAGLNAKLRMCRCEDLGRRASCGIALTVSLADTDGLQNLIQPRLPGR